MKSVYAEKSTTVFSARRYEVKTVYVQRKEFDAFGANTDKEVVHNLVNRTPSSRLALKFTKGSKSS